MRIWRISNHVDLSGRGGTLVDGRWHVRGVPAVYCTDHPSTALLEILVHATRQTAPDYFRLIEIDIPEEIEIAQPDLKEDWRSDLEFTQRTGMAFLSAGLHPLMKVPSVIVPRAFNYLLNPRHADAARITIVDSYRYPFDSRLFE